MKKRLQKKKIKKFNLYDGNMMSVMQVKLPHYFKLGEPIKINTYIFRLEEGKYICKTLNVGEEE